MRILKVTVILFLADFPALLLAQQAPVSIIYKTIDTTKLELRIFYPPGYNHQQKLPAIILFFGGGWTSGTIMQMESSGAASGEELRSARAQHTWVIPPQDVREAADGAFWLVQGGAIAAFRALPQRPVPVMASSTPIASPESPDPAGAASDTRETAA